MKRNSKMSYLLSRLGAGAVITVFCAFVPASRADVIVDNTTASNPGNSTVGYGDSSYEWAQEFTMSGTDGNISSLTLQMYSGSSGTSEVYIYNATSGGAPTTQLYDVGQIDSSGVVTVNSASDLLSAGNTYAVVLSPSAGVKWSFTQGTGNDSGAGSIGGLYFNYNNSGWTSLSPDIGQMTLQTTPVVPEIPVTGSLMGFGALAIAVGDALRRECRRA